MILVRKFQKGDEKKTVGKPLKEDQTKKTPPPTPLKMEPRPPGH